jgi:hypothetical protein
MFRPESGGRSHASRMVAFESAHRTESRLESAVVGFGPIVRELLGVVTRAREEPVDDSQEGRRPVGDDRLK